MPSNMACLFGPMTWVYISSTDVDATDVDDIDVDDPDDAKAEEDVPSGWDSNFWNWS